jgi:hypothetical protein
MYYEATIFDDKIVIAAILARDEVLALVLLSVPTLH